MPRQMPKPNPPQPGPYVILTRPSGRREIVRIFWENKCFQYHRKGVPEDGSDFGMVRFDMLSSIEILPDDAYPELGFIEPLKEA